MRDDFSKDPDYAYSVGKTAGNIFSGILKAGYSAYLARQEYKRIQELNRPEPVTMEQVFEHTHVVAGSGFGKTQYLQNCIMGDLHDISYSRRSVIVIDSQGDMIKKFLEWDAFNKKKALHYKTIWVNPSDDISPPALNLFDFGLDRARNYSSSDQEKLLNGAISLFDYMFSSLLGSEMTTRQSVNFRYIANLLMVIPNANIFTLIDILNEPDLAKPFLPKLDYISQQFFRREFLTNTYTATRRQILLRLYSVLSNKSLARMFSHPKSNFNMFQLMNEGNLIFIDTSKEHLKKEGCALFGRFMIALIHQAVMERATLPEERRLPCAVYIDEAGDYFDDEGALDDLFNQARKFKVGVTVLHQNIAQLSRRLHATINASTATKIFGGLSADDWNAFGREINYPPQELREMTKKTAEGATFIKYYRNGRQPLRTHYVPFGQLEREPKTHSPYENVCHIQNLNRGKIGGTPVSPEKLGLTSSSRTSSGKPSGFDLDDPDNL